MISRRGLNESEASLLWAAARFGASDSMARFVEPQARALLEPKLRGLATLDAEQRACLAQRWETLDASARKAYNPNQGAPSELWELGDSFSIHELGATDDDELLARLMQVGLFQLAAVVRLQDRRQRIRTQRELGAALDVWLERYLSIARLTTPTELMRIQEVVIALSQRFERVDERLVHIGLYFVACAAGTRFRRLIRLLISRLPSELGAALRGYHMRCLISSREDIAPIVYASLEAIGCKTLEGVT
ncbi:MAG: hypothetical protein H0U74_12540 [Bradymonadaceae bacterium]|nr:hypothetical protein [Lujinxingiaceae bacterium]